MIDKTRKRRGKKPDPRPLKRKRITITLTPKYHRQVAAHKSPGIFVEHCISLARCITREQYSRLVEIHLATGKTVDKLVHEAVRGYSVHRISLLLVELSASRRVHPSP